MTQAERRSAGLSTCIDSRDKIARRRKGEHYLWGRKSGSSTDPPDRSHVSRRTTAFQLPSFVEETVTRAAHVSRAYHRRRRRHGEPRCVTGHKEPILFSHFFMETSRGDAIFDGRSSPLETEFAFFFRFVMDSSGIRIEIYLDFGEREREIYGRSRLRENSALYRSSCCAVGRG